MRIEKEKVEEGSKYLTNCTGEDARTTNSLNRTSNNKGSRVGRSAANSRANLEDKDGREPHALDGEESVQLSKQQLETTGGEQVGRAVPAHVGERVELVGDLRDGRGDDQSVQSDEEHGQEDGGQQEHELDTFGVFVLRHRRCGREGRHHVVGRFVVDDLSLCRGCGRRLCLFLFPEEHGGFLLLLQPMCIKGRWSLCYARCW